MTDTWQLEAEGFMYPQASIKSLLWLFFEVEFFSELERRSFFKFSSSSKVKIWTFLAFSSWFEFRDCFAKVLGSFWALFHCFLKKKQSGIGFSGFFYSFEVSNLTKMVS